MDEPTPFTTSSTDAPSAEATPVVDARRPRRARRVRIGGFALAGALLLGIGGAGGAWGAAQLTHRTDSSTTTTDGSTFSGGATGTFAGRGPFAGGNGFRGGSSDPGSSSTTTTTGPAATAAQKVGVVTITTTLGYENGSAAGTGIVLTSSGEILTNNHVISGATAIKVTDETTDTTYTATVVGTDATDDIAVLQLEDASGLRIATLASSAASTGDDVTAVGNAGGTGELTTAAGTVTDLEQTITTEAEGSAASETLDGLIQTDADVIAGDSGGPLTNSAGAVVGIDTAASSGSDQVESYAIPIADALTIAHKIEAGDASSTITIGYPAFLGIQVDGTSSSTGATVAGALEGTPAASAGLSAGDTITEVDDHAISSGDDLTSTLRGHRPGDTVSVTYTDAQGDAHTTQVTLVQGPAN